MKAKSFSCRASGTSASRAISTDAASCFCRYWAFSTHAHRSHPPPRPAPARGAGAHGAPLLHPPPRRGGVGVGVGCRAPMTPWTEYTSIIALGVGANSENLPVGLAYAMRRCRIDLAPNLAIAALTTLATLIPLAAG